MRYCDHEVVLRFNAERSRAWLRFTRTAKSSSRELAALMGDFDLKRDLTFLLQPQGGLPSIMADSISASRGHWQCAEKESN
jgi:hypothetical protein